jgi:predicted XRE-type DNA-binding protein
MEVGLRSPSNPKRQSMTSETIEMGTGNLFADLGYADADAHLFKAQLVTHMKDVMTKRSMTQAAGAKASGVSQPDISRILKGHLRDVSVERIMRMLTRLGLEVDVIVRPQGGVAQVSAIRFAGAPLS